MGVAPRNPSSQGTAAFYVQLTRTWVAWPLAMLRLRCANAEVLESSTCRPLYDRKPPISPRSANQYDKDGGQGSEGKWGSSANHPITPRYVRVRCIVGCVELPREPQIQNGTKPHHPRIISNRCVFSSNICTWCVGAQPPDHCSSTNENLFSRILLRRVNGCN